MKRFYSEYDESKLPQRKLGEDESDSAAPQSFLRGFLAGTQHAAQRNITRQAADASKIASLQQDVNNAKATVASSFANGEKLVTRDAYVHVWSKF